MLTDLNDTHIIELKKKEAKIAKKGEMKPTTSLTVGTVPQTKRKIVERCKINTSNTCLFVSWGKPEDPEKTTDLSQVTDKHYYIMLCSSPWSGFELKTSVVIGTDCTGSFKSNYHTITATTAPPDCRRNSKENNDTKTGQISLHMGPSWSWSVIVYGKMIYKYQRIQCLAIAT